MRRSVGWKAATAKTLGDGETVLAHVGQAIFPDARSVITSTMLPLNACLVFCPLTMLAEYERLDCQITLVFGAPSSILTNEVLWGFMPVII